MHHDQQHNLRWRTSTITDSRVQYGPVWNALTNIVSIPTLGTEHVVFVANLQPNTQYYYSVGTGSGSLAAGTNYFFVTAPSFPKPTRIWVLGDLNTLLAPPISRPSAMPITALPRSPHRFVFDTWRYMQHRSRSGIQTGLFGMYSNLFRQTTIFPCLGNHDRITLFAQPY